MQIIHFVTLFFGSACFDNQLESLIKLQIRAYFDTNKADLVPSILYKVPNERLKEVLNFFDFIHILEIFTFFAIFTDTNDEVNFLKRYLYYSNFISYDFKNIGPKKRDTIHEPYSEYQRRILLLFFNIAIFVLQFELILQTKHI